GARPRGGAELVAQRGVRADLGERGGQGGGVVGWDQAAAPVPDHAGGAPHGGPDDGQPERHGLDEHPSHALVARGCGQHVGGGECVDHLGGGAGDVQAGGGGGGAAGR